MSKWFRDFGAMLYYLRMTYPEREARNDPSHLIGRSKMTQDDLIARLESAGYHLSMGALSGIENGTLPRDSLQFIEKVSEALKLNDEERLQLEYQLAFDLIKQRLGEEVARNVFALANPPFPPVPA